MINEVRMKLQRQELPLLLNFEILRFKRKRFTCISVNSYLLKEIERIMPKGQRSLFFEFLLFKGLNHYVKSPGDFQAYIENVYGYMKKFRKLMNKRAYKILKSKAAREVFKLLVEGYLTVNQIAKKSGMKHETVRLWRNRFEIWGIVKEKPVSSRLTLYFLNKENATVKKVLRYLRKVQCDKSTISPSVSVTFVTKREIKEKELTC